MYLLYQIEQWIAIGLQTFNNAGGFRDPRPRRLDDRFPRIFSELLHSPELPRVAKCNDPPTRGQKKRAFRLLVGEPVGFHQVFEYCLFSEFVEQGVEFLSGQGVFVVQHGFDLLSFLSDTIIHPERGFVNPFFKDFLIQSQNTLHQFFRECAWSVRSGLWLHNSS